MIHGGPAIYAILLVIGLLLVLGALVLSSARRPRAPGPVCPAHDCGHENVPHARYCARCGRELIDRGA